MQPICARFDISNGFPSPFAIQNLALVATGKRSKFNSSRENSPKNHRGFGGIGTGRAFTIGACFALALAHRALAAAAILALAAALIRRLSFETAPVGFVLEEAIIRSSSF
jgi:hypothetical protein